MRSRKKEGEPIYRYSAGKWMGGGVQKGRWPADKEKGSAGRKKKVIPAIPGSTIEILKAEKKTEEFGIVSKKNLEGSEERSRPGPAGLERLCRNVGATLTV